MAILVDSDMIAAMDRDTPVVARMPHTDHVGRVPVRPVTVGDDGATDRTPRDAGIRDEADRVLVTSVDEWHWRAQIEPSRRQDDRQMKLAAPVARLLMAG